MKTGKNGSVLVGLLVVIVLAMMIYMIDFSAMFGHIDENRAYEERPWFEEQRLTQHFPVRQTGKGGKAIILLETTLAGPVQRSETPRGKIEITVEPNGLAMGKWQCSYEHSEDKSSYTITADFKGNIDPAKTFFLPHGSNKKLLYLITKGRYKQLKTDADGKVWPTEAPVYVVGWIDKDHSAKGKIFLMSNDDPESHGNAEYDWQTEPKINAEKNK
jgi:hypothetical protein